MKPILYTSPLALKHNTGAGHPENAERIVALDDLFATAPFKDWPQKQSTKAELETTFLAHDEDYIFDLMEKTPDGAELCYLDGDTVLSSASFDAALYGVGAVCNAVDDIFNEENYDCNPKEEQRPRACAHESDTDITSANSNSTDLPSRLRARQHFKTQRAFCAIRPPGHHAEPNTALGFCLMNNIFIAARYAQEKYGVKNIAIIDFDVHHGNGTETMARRHNKAHPNAPISYISSHAYPLFPMTGDPQENDDYILNIRLPDKCASETFQNLYEKQVFPHLNALKPELILISAGFDAHIDDPLANICLHTDDFIWITEKLCAISSKYAQNRVISVLEGGYNVPVLTECVKAHLEVLAR